MEFTSRIAWLIAISLMGAACWAEHPEPAHVVVVPVEPPPASPVGDKPAPARSEVKPAKAAPKALLPLVYACPMHPDIRTVAPGECPICGMSLEQMPAAAPAP